MVVVVAVVVVVVVVIVVVVVVVFCALCLGLAVQGCLPERVAQLLRENSSGLGDGSFEDGTRTRWGRWLL